MDTNTATRRIIHQVEGSSAVRAWAFEPDENGEGGWLAIIYWQADKPFCYHVNSWVPGLLLAMESRGQSVGRYLKAICPRGARKLGQLDRAPGLYRGES